MNFSLRLLIVLINILGKSLVRSVQLLRLRTKWNQLYSFIVFKMSRIGDLIEVKVVDIKPNPELMDSILK